MSKHKKKLLTTIRTQVNLEQALEISKKKGNCAFEDVARLEKEVGSSKKRQTKPGITEIMLRQRHIRPFQS